MTCEYAIKNGLCLGCNLAEQNINADNIKKSTILSRYKRGKRNEELIKPVK